MLGWWDPNYIWLVLLPTLGIGLVAQLLVKAAYTRASRLAGHAGLTGAEVAREVLRGEGVAAEIARGRGHDDDRDAGRGRDGVRIEAVDGFLSDHYDPSSRTLRLSPGIYAETSLTAAAVAAHEAGHALQQAHGYLPLAVRTGIVPLVSVGQMIAPFAVMLGLATAGGPAGPLFQIGVLAYALMVVFALVTLPVEFNASRRALAALTRQGLITVREEPYVRDMLRAAALTYVAAAVTAILHLLYVLSLGRRSARD